MKCVRDTFNKLNKDKKKTIINAAIKEFAEKGYKNASTDNIVKNAGISKGALFLYFKNKESLYLYILDYAYNFLIEMMMSEGIDLNERDLFNRLVKFIDVKFKIISEYPYLSKLFETLLKEKPPQALDFMKSMKDFTDFNNSFLENIDTSNLRDDIPFEYIYKIIFLTFDGYGNTIINESEMTGEEIDYDKIFKETAEYIEYFKKIFYKNLI